MEYIANHPIYELCLGAEQIPGPIRFMKGWDQDITREKEDNDTSKGVEREVG